MTELINNIERMKEISREIYVFSNQINTIERFGAYTEKREKVILTNTIIALSTQLEILNKAIPELINRLKLYPNLPSPASLNLINKEEKLAIVSYKPEGNKSLSLVINNEDKTKFLESLSESRYSIKELNKKYGVEKTEQTIEKPNFYAKTSNYFFRNLSYRLISEGYFKNLNKNLRKINSRFVIGTYVSMIFFAGLVALFISLFLFAFLLFFKIGFLFPFITLVEESFFIRFFKIFWIVFIIPIISMALAYFYPVSEANSIGLKINQELPFVTIHMSAIASSGIEPSNIFKIILKGGEYKYTSIEFKKLMNLINFHGEDLVSALRKIANTSPSNKLKDLLNGFAVTITSGGDLNLFLNEHAKSMLFEYKLEREKYSKMSETFMDIYISVAVAAPMIFLMIFVIIGSTGLMGSFLGMSTNTLSFLLILILVVLNILFLIILKLKQPMI